MYEATFHYPESTLFSAPIESGTFTSTQTSAAIDVSETEHILFLFRVTTATTLNSSNYFTFGVTECETSGGTYTAIDPARISVMPRSTVTAQPLITTGYVLVRVMPRKKFMKVALTETGTSEIVGAVYQLTKHRVTT